MREKLKKLGLWVKICICLVLFLWSSLWLIEMGARFGTDPFSLPYIESSCFHNRMQEDMNQLSENLERYMSSPDNLEYQYQLTEKWWDSNLRISIVVRDPNTQLRRAITNTPDMSGIAIQTNWPFYYQHRAARDAITNAAFPLYEDWFVPNWSNLYAVTLSIASFDKPDAYSADAADFAECASLCRFMVAIVLFSAFCLLLLLIFWQKKSLRRQGDKQLFWQRLYPEELMTYIAILFCSLILVIQLVPFFQIWLEILPLCCAAFIPFGLCLYWWLFQINPDRRVFDQSPWLFLRLRADWKSVSRFALSRVFPYLLFLCLGLFLSSLWHLSLGWICLFCLLWLSLLLRSLRLCLERDHILQKLTAICQSQPYLAFDFRTSYYQQVDQLLGTLSTHIQQLVEDGLKAERLKVNLITNVSHDLKTPLTSIITYIRLLEKENDLSDQSAQYLQVLSKKSLQLKQLTEDLLDAARITSGNETIVPQQLNFAEMVHQANGEFALAFEEKHLELISNLESENLPAWIDGSKTWRILSNLYRNVGKYAMPGTRVYVDAALCGNYIDFCIKNVSKDPLNLPVEELIQRFVQGDSSRNTGGNGLGLTIAQELAVLQGGSLDIEILGDLFIVHLKLPIVITSCCP